jgi:hypothetical protein
MLKMSQSLSQIMRGFNAVVKATAWRDVIRLRQGCGWVTEFR